MALSVPLQKFYEDKRVLVTGHTGFKGSWLVACLKEMGSAVTGIALPPPADQPSLFESARVAAGINSNFADVRELDSICRLMTEHQPEILIHNAAQALVLESYRHPVETYATNVMGTVNVLEAARHTSSVRAVVVITSDKCYENREWLWGYRESDPLGGRDPYSSSKGCAELVTNAYRKSFLEKNGISIASARAGNVIGGGDWAPDRLMPDLMRGLAGGQEIHIRHPRAVRPWQHVLDPVFGYLMLAQQLCERGLDLAGPWNFGPRSGAPVEVIVDRVLALWGETPGRVRKDESDSEKHEAHSLLLDSTKAERMLGWHPLLPLAEALEWTVKWYRSFADHPDSVVNVTSEQIHEYMRRACGLTSNGW